VTIRDLLDDDLGRVLEINDAHVPAVGPLDLDRLRFLFGECTIALAVESGGELVGFCLVLGPGSTYDSVNYRWFMDRYDDALYLDRVAFDASAHRRGLGSALYDEVTRRAGDAARLTLEVNIDPPNHQSLGFHARRGFEEVGRQMSKGIEVSLLQLVF
jgi:predicted GNAT superfamily acetyltransferase